MIQSLKELQQTFPPLHWCTVYTVILLALSLGLMAFDSRLVVGANAWLKPVKFELSIIIFNLTIGLLLTRMSVPASAAKTIAWVVALTMFVEITAIVVQAARGVPSHYNFSSPFNAAIFAAMGLGIVLNTVAIGWLCVLSFQPQTQLPSAVAWGIRLGILLFLMSSLQGFQMVGNKGHTVGASDGGPGLPILRWSTATGDLRVAHFIGIHGIQILPLLGFALSRRNPHAGTAAVVGGFVAITALLSWTLHQAWAGKPLIRA